MTAACAGHPEPLWDAPLDGEHEIQTTARHARALAVCRSCPIRSECAAQIDVRVDDGVRGGILLPTIRDGKRGSWQTWQPGRGGIGRLVKAS